MRSWLRTTIFIFLVGAMIPACKSSSGLVELADETEEAGKVIQSANADLKQIKVLYVANENKRDDIKKAMEADDVEQVRKLSDEVNDLINEGAGLGKSALDKIEQARAMNINEDYAEYLRLKSEALTKQLEAFEQYRHAARKLRDSFDPKNAQVREAVAADFKQRSENYQKLMEKARDHSSQANELAKDVLRRKTEE